MASTTSNEIGVLAGDNITVTDSGTGDYVIGTDPSAFTYQGPITLGDSFTTFFAPTEPWENGEVKQEKKFQLITLGQVNPWDKGVPYVSSYPPITNPIITTTGGWVDNTITSPGEILYNTTTDSLQVSTASGFIDMSTVENDVDEIHMMPEVGVTLKN